jgi:ResB-like family protein
MENTAIQATKPAPPMSLKAPMAAPKKELPLWVKILTPIASLRITVVLFVLSFILVFIGTLAQVDAGIWTVVAKYFRSLFIWVPLQIFNPMREEYVLHGGFPFPGGWLLGGLLLVNLLAAHAVRFKATWNRSGILLLHAGIIVMMLSELITGLFAVESKMVIANGETVGFIDNSREVELAIINSSKPGEDDVIVVPQRILEKGGLVQNANLPFDLEVRDFVPNSALIELNAEEPNNPDVFIASDGNYYTFASRAEGTGVDPNQREDAAAVRVTFNKKGTQEKLGSGLFSLWTYPNFTLRQLRFPDQKISVDGKEYLVQLRFKRVYQPYSIHLIEFRHDRYIGTDTPKNYSSRIQLIDPSEKVDREEMISMNAPLRYAGLTFYQSGFLPNDKGTVLQVVRNPGWLLPYFSCAMVAIGMIFHFGLNLKNFLQKRMAS